MIFDIIIEKLNKDRIFPPLILNNPLESIYKSDKIGNPSLFSNDDFQIYVYGRGIKESIYKESDKNFYIIIGEVFHRVDRKGILGHQKINAEDLRNIYNEQGDIFINNVKGNFQIIIIQGGEIKIYNSKFGVSPFYYYLDKNDFVCSTAIYLFPKRIKQKINFSNDKILEYVIFNYPLGENTLIENVYNLLPGEVLIFSNGKVNKELYFNFTDLITVERISRKRAIEEGIELFNLIVNNLTLDKQKIAVSLTGGFDGRAIISALKFPRENLLLYSFGIKGSLNISIPLKIAKELGYNFKPFYLEDEYAAVYPEYAVNTCLLTDCLATIERANYLYVFEDLSNFTDTVITGIFGSELMRTFQNAGLMISDMAVRALKSKDPLFELNNLIDNYNYKEFWGEEIFNTKNKEIVLESFRSKYLNRKYEFLNQFIFTYFVKDALRKYFGGEVHAERIYATNRFPFLDDEFVEFVLKSPFSAINNTFMEPTIKEKLNSQIFYANILKKNNPILLKYNTDHGYAPKYLLYPFSIIFTGLQVFLRRNIRKIKKYTEFRPQLWFNILLRKREDIFNQNNFLNNDKIREAIKTNSPYLNKEELKKLFSINLYYQFIKYEDFN